MKDVENKFKFDTEWQLDLLKFTVQEKDGYRALKKYDDSYFTLIEHQIIAFSLKKFYKKYSKIPGKTSLKEIIRSTFTSRQFIDAITKDQYKDVLYIADDIYSEKLKDADIIYEQCKEFSTFVKFKNAIERVDIRDFSKFKSHSLNIQKSLEDEDERDDMQTSFLLDDVSNRQIRRSTNNEIFPTPFRQINKLTNAGGYELGSILVIIDKQKKGKTIVLVNIIRGYMRMGLKVLLIDLENGKNSMLSRLEQSIMKIDKMQLISGEHDDRIRKRFRKYKRHGSEVVVERLPANVTTTSDIQSIMDKYYQRFGIKFDILIIDWIGKMGSVSGKTDDFGRISDAYVDVANLAEKNKIKHVWSANHITREGMKRMATRYQPLDIAKCIDISRHVHAVFGLNRSKEEEEAGFQRMEIVEQRDGLDYGRAVFLIDKPKQRMDELTIKQRKEYDEQFYSLLKDDNPEENKEPKKPKRKFGDI